MERTNTDAEFLTLLGVCQMYSALIQQEISIYTSSPQRPPRFDASHFFALTHSTMGSKELKTAVSNYYDEEMAGLYSSLIDDRNAISHAEPTSTNNELAYINKEMDATFVNAAFLGEYIAKCKKFLNRLESTPPTIVGLQNTQSKESDV